MEEAGDFTGIAVPFTAGAVAGMLLFPNPSSISTLPAAALASTLFILTVAATLFLDSRINASAFRLCLATLFILCGLFCSISASLTRGIPTHPEPLVAFAHNCKNRLCTRIDSIPFPSSDTSGLLKALLTGDRSGLDRNMTAVFRNSGASHILALSGLHLGILYLLLSKLTIPLGNSLMSKKIRYLLIISAGGFYTVMTGASPSIVRAFLFILLRESAILLGRNAGPARILLSALTIQLVIEPDVISSTGFQLSYLAVSGIVFLYPALERLYPQSKGWDPFRKTWKASMLTVSCQVFTAPLAWLKFGTFPRYFLITNLIALPLTSAVMTVSVATTALFCLGICPYELIRLDDTLTRTLISCLEIISSM